MKSYIFIFLTLINITIMNSQPNKTSEKYNKGWNKLKEIDGEAGEKVVNGLKDISPELSRFIIEYSFGEVYSLTTLDNKSKEIVAISSLIAQGAIPELKVHLNGALNTGSTINEVKEIILQMSVYCGFPKCINGMKALRQVLEERKALGIIDKEGKTASTNTTIDKYTLGAKFLAILKDNQEQILKENFQNLSPELVRLTIEYGYGDIFSRDNLDKKYRQISTISALATLGNAQPQLKFHIEAGLNIGLTVDEIKEIMLMMTVYAGFPASINGTNSLKEVIQEHKNQ
ncbi:carboxymuconolactone decarboxylase family protein [Apibacter adventoris]|nr:carboxymuconolactone decarboxylase family protein [Apibacter adventoris]